MPRENWTREQDLAVLFLRISYGGALKLSHPAIGDLARAMNRSEASIWMRKGNFDSLDLSTAGKGLRNTAKLTRDIWDEYQEDPQRILAESRRAYQQLVDA